MTQQTSPIHIIAIDDIDEDRRYWRMAARAVRGGAEPKRATHGHVPALIAKYAGGYREVGPICPPRIHGVSVEETP